MSLQNFIILNELNMEDTFGELFVLITGGLLLIYFFILLYLIRKTRKWPTTIGQILFSEVATSGSVNDLHRVVVKYEYQIQGKLYVSNPQKPQSAVLETSLSSPLYLLLLSGILCVFLGLVSFFR